MQTKTLVIFFAGGIAGYLLSQYLSGKIEGVTPPAPTNPPTPNTTGQVDLNPKIQECQNKLNAKLAELNLPADKVQDYSDTFMSNCLLSN